VQGEVAHLAVQALLARRDHECRAGGRVEQLFQLLPVQLHVVDEDQDSLVLKCVADVGRGRLADPVALVEAVEDLLLQVARGLLPGGEVDDAISEGRGSRMIGEGTKQRRLADAGAATIWSTYRPTATSAVVALYTERFSDVIAQIIAGTEKEIAKARVSLRLEPFPRALRWWAHLVGALRVHPHEY
jgi:hypothetical protein